MTTASAPGRARAVPAAVMTALLAVLLVLAPGPAQACGCGGFVAADGFEVGVNSEAAVITWDGTTERILLSMGALTDAPDAALLIPTPARAEVALSDAEVFTELEEAIAPEVVVDYRWWPEMFTPGDGGVAGAAPGEAPVSVLETVRLGPLEVSVLAANDADALTAWLQEHGYVMGDGLADALMPYVTESWYYLAVRLTPESGSLSGGLQPLDISFASRSLIYPMRLSVAARDPQFVRTYVLAEHRMERTDATAEATFVETRFAGRLSTEGLRTSALVELVGDAPYLTVLDQQFYTPSDEIVSDFTFERSASDDAFREVLHEERMREILGVPAGPALVVLGVLAVVLTGLLLLRRGGRFRPTAPR